MRPQSRYQPGDKIGGRYQVHEVKMGGMGEVYLCLDLKQIYPAALKTFQQRHLSNARALRRAFEKEVATWVALEKHPNLVRCFLMDILDNQPFMVLEWIGGEQGRGADLCGWLRHGPLDLQLALEIAIDICRGLAFAQKKQPGLVHRDLKPENILMAQGGMAKVTDFGLAEIIQQTGLEFGAALLGRGGRQSIIGRKEIAGTPGYMAPEQWRGEDLDERTDIYAVGCILYEMLTGESPFQVDCVPLTHAQFQDWLRAMQAAHESGRVTNLPASLPENIKDLVRTCLAREPSDRHDNFENLMAGLTSLYQVQFEQEPPSRPAPGETTADDITNCGLTYQHLEQHEKALADFNRAIELDRNYARAYSNRGGTFFTLKQPRRALADLNRAIELQPNYARAYSNRGTTYAALQLYEQALADYNRSIELDPHDALAYYNRGNTYAALQLDEQALADFTRTVELDPAHFQALSNRGSIYSALQFHEQALADFTQAIELNPNEAHTYSNRGGEYLNLQQYERALADLTPAIELDPNYARAYLYLGVLFGNQGKQREALEYFEKSAQLGDPEGAQYVSAARQMLGMEPVPPTEQGIIAFQQAGTLEAMRQAVDRYPFLALADFISVIEQAIAQGPPEHRSAFGERLAWLRQIAAEHRQKE